MRATDEGVLGFDDHAGAEIANRIAAYSTHPHTQTHTHTYTLVSVTARPPLRGRALGVLPREVP